MRCRRTWSRGSAMHGSSAASALSAAGLRGDQPPPGSVARCRQGRVPARRRLCQRDQPGCASVDRSLAERCDAGALLVIDYGFPEREYYHPQRSGGTLVAHYRHRAVHDPLFCQHCATFRRTSISAHRARRRRRRHDGRRLCDAGALPDQLRDSRCGGGCGDPQTSAYLRQAAAVQKLLSPAEMGELFKVLELVRGVDGELVGFSDGDQDA